MNEERINELFSDEQFVNNLFASESFEEAQKMLADNDVEISIDELKKAFKLIQKKESGELTDEELEEIAGGFFGWIVGSVIVASIGMFTATYLKKNNKC